jgi:hypothetical protein
LVGDDVPQPATSPPAISITANRLVRRRSVMFGESFRYATAVSVDQPAILPVRRAQVQKLSFWPVWTLSADALQRLRGHCRPRRSAVMRSRLNEV